MLTTYLVTSPVRRSFWGEKGWQLKQKLLSELKSMVELFLLLVHYIAYNYVGAKKYG